jgi:hypothetical protein
MNYTLRLTIITAAILILSAPFAFAQDVDVNVAAEASIGAPMDVPRDPSGKPIRPLDAIRKAQQVKQNIQERALDQKRDLREGALMQMKSATSGAERRDIMKDAAREGAGIMKNRMASTSGLKMKIKDAVRRHGGLIRERFANAIQHLTGIMGRIETRVEKMKTNGIDVSAVESLQVRAEAAIDTAETDIAAVKTYIEGVSETSDRETVRTELDARIKEARESIRLAHEAVRQTVKALADLAKENRPAANASVEAGAAASTDTATE